jgi:secreted Zn-dependent insulinase-like peptidase
MRRRNKMSSQSAQRLLDKLQANNNKKRRRETITISSLIAARTNLKSAEKTIAAVRELQMEGLINLQEIMVEGRFERELIIIIPPLVEEP